MTDTLRHALALDNLMDAMEFFQANLDETSMPPFVGLCGQGHHDAVATVHMTGDPAEDIRTLVRTMGFAIEPTHVVTVMSSWLKVALDLDQAALDQAMMLDHDTAAKLIETDPSVTLGIMSVVFDCATDETTVMAVMRHLDENAQTEWVRGQTVVTPDIAEMIEMVQAAYKWRPEPGDQMLHDLHYTAHVMAKIIEAVPTSSNQVRLLPAGFLMKSALHPRNIGLGVDDPTDVG